jgi:predicted dehydrogenase
MARMAERLGVGVVGIGWCASQHIAAFRKNPHTRVVALVGRDADRVRATLAKNGQSAQDARISTRFEDLLDADDVQVIDIATPNDLHAAQAVAAARAGKHILLEKPTGMNVDELIAIRDAVRAAGVRTIVSFELRYNPWLRFIRWMRESGRLGRVVFARTNYLSRVTDWYSGWEWCRTVKGGGSHLLAAGCHAVDALRWATGLEIEEVSAYHMNVTPGYEWPTTIDVNVRFAGGALGHVTSSTDFQMPYTFGIEVMGDKATVRDTYVLWKDEPIALEALRAANPFPEVTLHETIYGTGSPAIRIETVMPDTADVTHHPFQAEIDDFVDAILAGRETMLNVFDAQITMEACLAADRSAIEGGRPVALPLIRG